MEADEAVEKAKSLLGDILEQNGAVLFSGIDTLVPGSLYVMAFNPGGDPEDPEIKGTIHESLEARRRSSDWADVDYGPSGPSVFQSRIRSVFEALGADPRKTLCTNALFVRSTKASGVEKPWDLWWDRCWPVHQLFLSIVQPRVVVCFGNGAQESAWAMLRTPVRREDGERAYKRAFEEVDGERSTTGNWLANASLDLGGDVPHVCGVLGLPHPSQQVTGGWVHDKPAKLWKLAEEPLEKLAMARAAAVAWDRS